MGDGQQPGRSKRVLIVVSSDRRRGAEVFSERLRDGLARLDWVVEAVSLTAAGSEPRARVEPLTPPGSRTGRFSWRVMSALRRKIRDFRPDIIVANGGSTLRYAVTSNLGLGIDVAYVGIGEPEYWIRSRMSRSLNRALLRRTDLVLTVSEATRLQLVDLEPSLVDRSHTVFTGIEPAMLDLGRGDVSGPLRVIMLGSLSPEKDPSLALRAVAAVPGARLRFVGTGPLEAVLQREVEELGMAERVELIGSVDDVSPHLEWAHLLILSSRTEGLPGVILEASAAGIPVVAVDVGGVREAVIDGETGFVTGRDVGDLADAMRRLEADRDLMRRMGDEGRRMVRDRFLLDDIVEGYRSVLEARMR